MNSIPNIDDGFISPFCQSLIEDNLPQTNSSRMPKGGRDEKRMREAHADRFAAKKIGFGDVKEGDCSKEPGHMRGDVLKSSTCSLERDVTFYRAYLAKRLEETRHTISGAQLFKEIQSRGYRGSLRQVQRCVAPIRKECSPKGCLAFHQKYLIKRLQETRGGVSGIQLFKEIQSRGYRGSQSYVRKFLATIRRDTVPPEECLAFHQEYLTKRLEETRGGVSGVQLFKEIQSRGYRGSESHAHHAVTILRREISLKKVQVGGYRGSIKSVQDFLLKKEELGESSLSFHKNHLIKRRKKSRLDDIPVSKLCRKIRANGSRESDSKA